MVHEPVYGYKGFNEDMTCRGFQYEVGQTYEHDRDIGLCKSGFHFCRNMADVLNYYRRNDCRYAVVEALGKVIDGEHKSVTDKLHIVRELTREEVFKEMAVGAGISLEYSPFPADELIKRLTGLSIPADRLPDIVRAIPGDLPCTRNENHTIREITHNKFTATYDRYGTTGKYVLPEFITIKGQDLIIRIRINKWEI